MDKVRVQGGKKLTGAIQVSGSKNAALPILFSTLLTGDLCELGQVPHLQDISSTLNLLEHLGCKIENNLTSNRVSLDAGALTSQTAPYELVRKMRASFLTLGPLLARFGKARVSLPGGCAIGARPVNFHLTALEKMGAEIELDEGYVNAKASRLIGNRVAFEFPSVGATEQLMMAACLARGETLLENCAKEPEISDLARVLKLMGAEIEGAGTETIRIQGKDRLHGLSTDVMGDRIEAGTYLAAAFATGGEVLVRGVEPEWLESVLATFEEAGAKIERKQNQIGLKAIGQAKAISITTLPFPGFPTDMQAQLMAVLCLAEGTSIIRETIFENRFMHVPELIRMGADITIKGNTALIKGREHLKGAPLMATDLRASASLIIAAMAAEGESIIHRIYHLDRGYERMEEKLKTLGAEIERVK